MHNIWQIFKDDIKGFRHNPVAILLLIGIIAIPSLYAWVNIYAFWDPYSRTGDLKIGVVNNDQGTEVLDLDINVGEKVVSELAANDQMNWIFTAEDAAMDSLKSGEYYAVLLIPADFSSNLLSFLSADIQKAEIKYFSNQKKNAVASKITDIGMENLQSMINQSFVATLADTTETILQQLSGSLGSGSEALEANVQAKLAETKNALGDTINIVEATMELIKASQSTLNGAGTVIGSAADALEAGEETVSGTRSLMQTVNSSLEQIGAALQSTVQIIGDGAESIAQRLEQAAAAGSAGSELLADLQQQEQKLEDLTGQNISVLNRLQALRAELGLDTAVTEKMLSQAENLQSSLQSAAELLNKLSAASGSEELAAAAAAFRQAVDICTDFDSEIQQQVLPALDEAAQILETNLSSVQTLLQATNSSLAGFEDLSGNIDATLAGALSALNSTHQLLLNVQEDLGDFAAKLKNATQSEVILILEQILKDDPETLAAFIGSPVMVSETAVYPIENYGSAMAPFLTILASWAGALILVAIFNINIARPQRYKNYRPYQGYFGRFLFLGLITVLQSLLCCCGDLWLLQIQCLHPLLFVLTGVVSSLVFSLFVYSLTIAMGSLGKGLAVVILVVQIAGAGGTFPVELLPTAFQAVNPVMPFTFAINAMRECIGGFYGTDFMQYLGLLCLIYIPLALLIGILLRQQLSAMKSWLEKRLDSTHLF